MNTTEPPTIGTVREYEGVIEVIYPGERAEMIVPYDAQPAGLRSARLRIRVYPAPGLYAWCQRAWYRLTQHVKARYRTTHRRRAAGTARRQQPSGRG